MKATRTNQKGQTKKMASGHAQYTNSPYRSNTGLMEGLGNLEVLLHRKDLRGNILESYPVIPTHHIFPKVCSSIPCLQLHRPAAQFSIDFLSDRDSPQATTIGFKSHKSQF